MGIFIFLQFLVASGHRFHARMRICARSTKGAPFYEQKELRSSGKPQRRSFANGARNCNIFTSGSICEGQHHHNFVRIASVR